MTAVCPDCGSTLPKDLETRKERPNGRWIASAAEDGTIRLWPMPEGHPFHTLPYAELLSRLRALTNLRVAPDAGSATGYKVEPGPFPRWAKFPDG